MFCTDGSEMPTALAMAAPTSSLHELFHLGPDAISMTARLEVLAAAVFFGRPAFRRVLDGPPCTADRTALKKEFRSGKPYC